MDTHRRTTASLALAALLSLSLAACSSSSGSAGAPTSAPSAPAAVASSAAASTASGAATLAISGFTFSPLSVAAGATVTVTNADAVEHTVTVRGENIDVKVPGGGSATFTAPATPGTYELTCDFHPDMKGTLTVT